MDWPKLGLFEENGSVKQPDFICESVPMPTHFLLSLFYGCKINRL